MGRKLGRIRYTLMTVIRREYVKSGKTWISLGVEGVGGVLPGAGKWVTTQPMSICP